MKNYQLSDIPKNVTLCSIIRDGEITIPHSKTKIFPGDELLLFLKPKDIKTVESLFK